MSTCEHDRQDDVCWECKDAQIADLERALAEVGRVEQLYIERLRLEEGKTDALRGNLTAAQAYITALEEEDRVWDKHSLTKEWDSDSGPIRRNLIRQFVKERRELRERVAALTKAGGELCLQIRDTDEARRAVLRFQAVLTPAKEIQDENRSLVES